MDSEKKKRRDFSGVTMMMLGIAALLVLLLIVYGVLSSNVDLVKRVLGDTSASENSDNGAADGADDGLMDSDEFMAWLDDMEKKRDSLDTIDETVDTADTADAASTDIPADYEKDYAGADVIVVGDMYATDASGNTANEKPLDDAEQQYVSSGNVWSDNAVG